MASVRLGAALRQIRGLFEAGTVAGLTDGQLLDRYLTRRDESAFAALVMRHGPMVLGVCHAVLHGSPEVEDAFQATFLVLIRKAATIRGRDAVGGWLHRVAHRVAVEAGRDRSRRDRREHAAGDLSDDVAAGEAAADDDWRVTLHEELARLPERFRQPVVLCYLEGKTHAQAALELRWSEATLRRRLADARGLLRSRLARRGVAVSGGALAAAMASQATAAVPPAWVDALARVAAGPAGAACGGSAAAARLAGEGRPEPARRPGADRRERRDRARSQSAWSPGTWSRRDRPGPTIPPGRRCRPLRRQRPRPTAPGAAKAEIGRDSSRSAAASSTPMASRSPGPGFTPIVPNLRPGERRLLRPGARSPTRSATPTDGSSSRCRTRGFPRASRCRSELGAAPSVAALARGFGPAWASVATADEAAT